MELTSSGFADGGDSITRKIRNKFNLKSTEPQHPYSAMHKIADRFSCMRRMKTLNNEYIVPHTTHHTHHITHPVTILDIGVF
jgi:hypothetical protein